MQADLHMSNQLSRQASFFLDFAPEKNLSPGTCSATRSRSQVPDTTSSAQTSSVAGAKLIRFPNPLKLVEVPGRCQTYQSKSFLTPNRDHGIPGYIKVREKCGLSPILSLQERPAEINEVNEG